MGNTQIWRPISDSVVTDRRVISIRGFGSTDCELQIGKHMLAAEVDGQSLLGL